jgi:hypothetical protein
VIGETGETGGVGSVEDPMGRKTTDLADMTHRHPQSEGIEQ